MSVAPTSAPTSSPTTSSQTTRSTRGAGVGRPAVRSAALALVSAATALAFGRVFRDGGFAPLLLVAALVPHFVGFVGRVRRWSVRRTVVIAVLAITMILVWIVVGETTAYGLPTPATGTRIGHLLGSGWTVFRIGIAPVTPEVGVVLLCAIAMALSAIVADAIGRRPDVTLGALAPTLVLFVLTGTLGTGALRIPTTVAYVAAAMVAIVIANAARVEQRRTWFTGRRLASDAAVVRSAAFVGGIAVLTGLALTPLVPGVDSPALVRYRNHAGGGSSGGGDFTTVSPLVDLRARLGTRSREELFRVTSPRALNWRMVALDRFDGQVWSVTSEARDAADTFRSRSDRHTVTQTFAIGVLNDRWVPAAFTPVRTNMGNARVIPDSSTLIAPNPIGNQVYEVRSRVETPPTTAQIAATAADGPTPASVRRALVLPTNFPQALRDQARGIIRASKTPYAQAQALEHFFKDGSFHYDLNVAPSDATEAITEFLQVRRGFCQQFAGAYAALARAAGLASRVVVGFTPGERDDASGDFIVRGRDAHAWVEVWFAGLGWRTFDPTPAGPAPGQADARAGAANNTDPSTDTTPTTSAATPATAPPRAAGGANRIPKADTLITTQHHAATHGFDPRAFALLALPLLALGAAAAFLGTRQLRRLRSRRLRRHAAEPAERVGGAWRDALEACVVAGLPISAALTPSEQVVSIGRHGAPPDSLPPLRDLAITYGEIEFSPHPPDIATTDHAWSAAEEVRTALLVGVGPATRARRAIRASFIDWDAAELLNQ